MTFRFRPEQLFLGVLVLAVGGCMYGFTGGGGLPGHLNTISVPPAENDTPRFVLTERFTQGMLEAVEGRLGAESAAEADADAVFWVTLSRYNDEALGFEAREGVGADVFQRRVTISASVELLDRVRDEVLWSGTVTGTGQYVPDEESEDAGMDEALDDLIQKIVDRAQGGGW